MTTTVKLKSKYWPSSCSTSIYYKRVCCPCHIQMSIRFVDSPNICHMTTQKRVFIVRGGGSFSCIVAGRWTGQFNNRIHHHNALNIYIQPDICWDALLSHSSGEYFCSTYPQHVKHGPCHKMTTQKHKQCTTSNVLHHPRRQ